MEKPQDVCGCCGRFSDIMRRLAEILAEAEARKAEAEKKGEKCEASPSAP